MTCNFSYPQKVSGDPIYSIAYNGHEIFSIVNNAAIETTGMTLTLGDTYYSDANSQARNIILEEAFLTTAPGGKFDFIFLFIFSIFIIFFIKNVTPVGPFTLLEIGRYVSNMLLGAKHGQKRSRYVQRKVVRFLFL